MDRINYRIGDILGSHGVKYVSDASGPTKHRYAWFECLCGEQFVSRIDAVKTNKTRSCGCYQKKRQSEANSTHGESQTPLYKCYHAMVRRCTVERSESYGRYGARGVTVCDEWLSGYENFAEWAKGNGYEKGLEIDRIDNNKGYSPENCRWTTHKENARNTSKGYQWITPDGVFNSLSHACEFYGKDVNTRFRNNHEGYIKVKKYL